MIDIKSIQETVSKLVSTKTTFYILTILFLVIGILPYLYLFQFSFPLMDDFVYNMRSNNYSFWEAQKLWYLQWTGRYTSTIFLSLFSHSFQYYSLILFLILLMLILTITISMKYYFQLSYSVSFLISSAFTLFIINTMPNIPEGLYWLASTTMYIFPLTFVPLFISIVQPYLSINKKNNYFHFFQTIVFLFFLIGFNEPMAFVICIHLLILLIIPYFTTKKINYPLLILTVVAFLGVTVIGLAPGNYTRTTEISNQINPKLILYSLFHTIAQLNRWLFFVPTIPLIIVLFFSFHKFIVNRFSSYNFPIYWNVLQLLLSLFSCNVIVLYSINSPPPGRMLNIMYIYFIVMILHISKKIIIKYQLKPKKKYKIISLLFLISTSIGSMNYQNTLNDIIGGDAENYHNELKKRHAYLHNTTSKRCEVPPINTKPKNLFIGDITGDYNNWHNQMLANYYSIDTLITSKITNRNE